MALEIKIKVKSRSADGKTFTVEDTTGAYNAADNLTGYGGANPNRIEFRSVFFADMVNSSGVTATEATGNSAEQSVAWVVNSPNDGYYDMLLVLARQFNLFRKYENAAITFYNGKLYQAKTVSSTLHPRTWTGDEINTVLQAAGIYNAGSIDGPNVLNILSRNNSDFDIMDALTSLNVAPDVLLQMPAFITLAGFTQAPDLHWEEISSIAGYPLTISGTEAYYARSQYLHTAYTEKCKLNRDTAFASTDCSTCCGGDETADMLSYYKVERAYKGAISNFGLGNYLKGGDQIEMAQRLCENGKCCSC